MKYEPEYTLETLKFYLDRTYRYDEEGRSPRVVWSSAVEFGRWSCRDAHKGYLPAFAEEYSAEMLARYLMNELGYRVNSETGEWMKVLFF